MNRFKLPLLLLGLAAGVAGLLIGWRAQIPGPARDFLVFDRQGVTCSIVLPDVPSQQEREAGELMAETLAAAAGLHPRLFPVVLEKDWRPGLRCIFVGATRPAERLYRLAGESALERPVAWTVRPEGVMVRARWREDAVIAASWFLEQTVGAHWYIPGPLGREVDARPVLRLAYGDHAVHPAYLSRSLGGLDRPEELAWAWSNRLLTLFEHGHTAARIFNREELTAQPALAPLLRGQRYLPTGPEDGSWQPNFTAPAAAILAAKRAKEAFQAAPDRLTFAVGQNDTFRFDQTTPTLNAIAPRQFFRHKPDYANLLFGFLNPVAKEVARDFPDRYITTYSYDWTENAPRFPVEPNILPFLTADRSDWFDPQFAEADQALMRRWRNAGPRMFALYDYYYGAPFFVPRPTLYAVSQPIPYAYETGARGFYAECFPNWGLDGPKLWLASQLLWDARADPAALLAGYYRQYWREAAEPMREYFELCDRQWLQQPKPAAWIKYYKDDHQCLLFPAEVRRELRAKLDQAAALAQTPVVRQRVRLCQAGFALTEAFCRHNELRDELQRLALRTRAGSAESAGLVEAWNHYSLARQELRRIHESIRRDFPLAVKSELLGEYLRHDPRRRVVWTLAGNVSDLSRLPETDLRTLFAGQDPLRELLHAQVTQQLTDPELTTLHGRFAPIFTLLEWAQTGTSWVARGEPYEHRRIEILTRPEGRQAVRYAGCNQESLFQWVQAKPDALYLATVQVQARVSPGNMTFLIVTFADRDGNHIGQGEIDRLPVGEWGEGTVLQVLVRAPHHAATVAVGVRTLWQVNNDFAEYESLSLRCFGQR